MSSELQQQASKSNGSKSRGPKTPAGKARSSRNALTHGLTSRVALATGESDDEYDELLNAYLDQFDPAPGVETELVESMAFARWRLRRLLRIESHLFDLELCRRGEDIDDEFENLQAGGRLAYVFQELADRGRTLQMLIRYEGAMNRTHDRALKQLQKLRALRPAPDPPSPDSVPSGSAPHQKVQNEPGAAAPPQPQSKTSPQPVPAACDSVRLSLSSIGLPPLSIEAQPAIANDTASRGRNRVNVIPGESCEVNAPAAAPEPSALGLMMLSAAGLTLMKHDRKQDRSPASSTTFDASEEMFRKNVCGEQNLHLLSKTSSKSRLAPNRNGQRDSPWNTFLRPNPTPLGTNGLPCRQRAPWAAAPNTVSKLEIIRAKYRGFAPVSPERFAN